MIARLALIVAGYAVAYGAGSLAVWWHDRALSPDDQLAMSGMLAFGDMVLFWAVAAPLAMIPTIGVFSLVRARPRFWRAYAIGSVVLSLTGIVEGLFLLVPVHTQIALLQTLKELSPVRVLAAPVFMLAYAPGLSPSAAPYRKVALVACLLEVCTMASFVLWLVLARL